MVECVTGSRVLSLGATRRSVGASPVYRFWRRVGVVLRGPDTDVPSPILY